MNLQKTLTLTAILACFAVSANAAPKRASEPAPSHSSSGSYGVSGCGLGTYVFKDHSSKVQMILAATTNGTSGNQTFGISTGTSNCEIADGKWVRFSETDSFVAANYDQLSRDAATGGGESLQAMTQLMGCSPTAQAHVGKLMQRHHDAIFAGTTAKNAPEVVANIKAVMQKDHAVAQACNLAAL